MSGMRFLSSEMATFEQMSTKAVAKPMLMPLSADVVVPSVGHMPSSSTKVGFSLIRPFKKTLKLFIVYLCFRVLQ